MLPGAHTTIKLKLRMSVDNSIEKRVRKLTFRSFCEALKGKEKVLFIDMTCVLCRNGYHTDYFLKRICLMTSSLLFAIYFSHIVNNFFLFLLCLGVILCVSTFLHIVAAYYEYCAIIEAHPESKQSGKYLT